MSDLKIFTSNVEQKAMDQIELLLAQPAFSECAIRIMPDVHAGAGCVIGFTANLGEKVIPNIVGVDIGCGMRTVKLGKMHVDYAELDSVIRSCVPSGRNVHEGVFSWTIKEGNLFCYKSLKNVDWINRSLGTLGGGNHFIEIDEDDSGNKYLIIHTGSRNLGKQVADIYQNIAIDSIWGECSRQEIKNEIEKLKSEGRFKEIADTVKVLKAKQGSDNRKTPKELCYLEGNRRKEYLSDMHFCQMFAVENRERIAEIIIEEMGWGCASDYPYFETIHNYVEQGTNMVRKGAISAKDGEELLIPINMRDGCILGTGLGNPDWNYSAPHGAGRIMSRRKAREAISLNDFKESMQGIYSSSVGEETIDESPMAYKPINEIIENIKDTVRVDKILKPKYNFKASE